MNLGIVGGRDYTNYQNFKKIVDDYIKNNGKISKIISGGAKGVDSMAEIYAKDNNIPIEIYKPNWKLGKSAGIQRNTDIVNNCTHLLALPTEKSVGTYDSIRKANIKKISITIVKV